MAMGLRGNWSPIARFVDGIGPRRQSAFSAFITGIITERGGVRA